MDQLPEGSGAPAQKVSNGSLAVLAVASVILSRIPIGNFFFTIPLVMVCSQLGKASKAFLCYVAVIAVSSAMFAFDAYDRTSGSFSVGLFVFSIFIPVALGFASAVWSCTGYSRLGYKVRYLASGAFAAAASVAVLLLVTFGNKITEDLRQTLTLSYNALFSSSIGLTSDDFLRYSLLLFQYALVPLSLVILGVSIVMGESSVHKNDQEWQDRVGRWSIPNDFVWVLLASFFAAIISGFLDFPKALNVVLWNLALVSCVVYGIQGFAILVFNARKKASLFTVHRMTVYIVIMAVIPGLNIAAFAGLPLLGVLETWIVLRKPNKENSYEDHFES